ncbi:ABC transporter [Mesotoga sp. HF07.pep.5.2.highcov]|jgi:zinc transport system permease protein|uniref:ABC-type Mn2+/Zn2+ transport system, permease component n=1 Tax=Mesotoga prima MesG1.Ag.4.2 TaxID=660470 RepID=I2F6N2_9BACT|nr:MULTISPECIES: metal ABC transporter permease [Mesotoga]AFK07585.1 ABC-type Mn2+/Zn2+ transport system, permease component [Mesotoga prima MesG1.Ag.4.2]PIJ60468.1 ABC transporter [Mesotoga sp. H07.pep.5.3]RLL90756.1 ABC transporter [Mesotoga sp. HF07.pep.5.2.highcov]HQC14263.1 metal ABC transporter permease [Mesotoga prima]
MIQDFISDIISYSFLRNAILAAVLVSALTGIFSSVVVLRKIEFIGDGAAHATFGGIAFGLLLGTNYILMAAITAVIFAVAVSYFTRKNKLSESSVIGMLLPLSMSLGVIALSFIRGYTPDVMGLFFGNILMVTSEDVWMLLVANVIAWVFFAVFYRELLYYSYDEGMAKHYGVPIGFIHYAVLIGISLSVVGSVKIAGIILVTAFLVIPAVTSKTIARSFRGMILISLGMAVVASVMGIFVSYVLDMPPGPVIVVMLFMEFLITFSLKALFRVRF